MKTIPFQFILALLAGAAASGQPGEPPAEGNRRPPPIPPLLGFFDADHDGKLSEREVRNASKALARLDRNNDGQITLDEVRPPRPQGGDVPQGPPPQQAKLPPPPVIDALDSDKDGTISAEELQNAPESLKSLDLNGDGELLPEELHPHAPPPDGGDGRDPQGPPPEDGGDPPMEIE